MTTPNNNSPMHEAALAMMAQIKRRVLALECDYTQLHFLHDSLENLRGNHEDAVTEFGAKSEEAADAAQQLIDWKAAFGPELARLDEMSNGCRDREEAQEHIQADAVTVELRSGWYQAGHEPEPEEFRVTLRSDDDVEIMLLGHFHSGGARTAFALTYRAGLDEPIQLPIATADAMFLAAYTNELYFAD